MTNGGAIPHPRPYKEIRDSVTKPKDTPAIDVSPEKLSGYFFKGKEIVLGPKRGAPFKRKHHNPKWYPQHTKEEACALYAVYGSVEEVSKLLGIPEGTIRAWKQEPWWVEILKEVYIEQNDRLGARISTVLDKSLDELVDRLENGDYVYSRKDGKLVRKPVDAKILAILFDSLTHRRSVIRGEPTNIVAKIGEDDRLKKLQKEFERFANATQIEGQASAVVEELQEGLQSGVPELPFQPGAEEETCDAEYSTEEVGTIWESV